MSLLFPYLPVVKGRPLVSLGGRLDRPRPLINVTILGPAGALPQDALIDTGADDTVFSEQVAALIGLDLTNAPQGTAEGINQGAATIRYAQTTLRIADNKEKREWQAWIGFTAAQMRYPILGFAGFLQYFTATFFGDSEEVELTVNGLYPGT